MYDFGDLSRELLAMAKSLKSDVANDVKQFSLILTKNLIYRTPVDTSQALSNWQVLPNATNDTFLLPYFAGKGGSTQNQSANAANMQASQNLSSYADGVIHVFNNAPYIVRLDSGYSGQTPAGFVNTSIQSAINSAPRKF